MPIHHYIEQYFQQFPKSRIEGIEVELPPLDKRPKGVTVKDETITLGVAQEDIPIRVFTPTEGEEPFPLIVFFHGGGIIDGNLEAYDVSCRLLATLSAYKILAFDYKLNSNQSISMIINTYYDALKWIFNNTEQLNILPDEIVIAGASIGGFLATNIALKSIQSDDFKLAKQVLYYPFLNLQNEIAQSEFQSRALYNGKYGLDITSDAFRFILDDPRNAEIAPLLEEPRLLSKLPKTLLFTAEYDPLCDEGELYGEKLKECGVDVRICRFDGNIHGLMQNFPGSPDNMRGYDISSEFLNSDFE